MPTAKTSRADVAVLTDVKECMDYGTTELRDIRSEADTDMRYVSGDPWSARDRQAREALDRPVLEVDEINQYLNQAINDLRQNKRGIKVAAKSSGATSDTARFRQGKIRDIEYQSNAQQAYLTMAENAFQRSYGFLRIVARYCYTDRGFNKDLFVEPVVNPECVTPDPDHQRPDGSDMNWLIYAEEWTEKAFKRQFRGAKITDFNAEVRSKNKKWFRATGRLTVGEYWTKEPNGEKTLYLLKPEPGQEQAGPREVDGASLKTKPSSDQIIETRVCQLEKVMQYLTNGVEILEKNPWPGPSIPWVTCYGKVLYMKQGSQVVKKIMSMIRLARSPQMLYAYYRTQQAEMAGMIPKVPVMGYKGQFRGVEQNWGKANHEPVAFLEANAKTVETGDAILPLPQRLAYEAGAHLQALELCAEGARRAIQAAMGITPLPTSAQRQNEKSGVALKKIEDSAQRGSFHFVDHYDESVMRCGAILDECIPFYYDAVRETSVRQPNDDVEVVTINDPNWIDPKTNQPRHIDAKTGDHDVTISVGPAQASEREAASDFADTLLSSKEIMMVAGPERASKIVASAIRLKDVGPLGDQMADIFDPKDNEPNPQQVAQQMQGMQQQLQKMQQQLQEAQQAIQTDVVKQKAMLQKTDRDNLTKVHLQAMQDGTTIAVAKIQAATKGFVMAGEQEAEAIALNHQIQQTQQQQAHEVALGAQGQAHARELDDLGQQHTLAQGDQAHQQQLALGAQGHAQALEQGAAGHAQQLEQGQQAADLAPEPTEGA